MLTSRELATVIIVVGAVAVTLLLPKSRARTASSLKGLVKAALHPRLLWSYLAVLLVSAGSTAIAWRIGLWDLSLLKDAALLTLTVVLPMTVRSIKAKSGGSLARNLVRDTLSLTALLAFYLDTAPLPLGWELLYQLAAILLVMMQFVAARDPRHSPAKLFCNAVLVAMGLFLVAWTTVSVIRTPLDWPSFFQSLFFSFWLPITLLPFFYFFAVYALAGQSLARFRALKRPLSLRLKLAFLVGTRLRLGLLTRFNGRYNDVGEATGFRDGLEKMRRFREDLDRRNAEEAARLRALSDNAGVEGLDDEGHHRDRREFDVTKERLEWIWTTQTARYKNQGGRYWDHMTDLIVDAPKHGLPVEHGLVVEIADKGQVWRAWRRTPVGAVLAIGGRELHSKFYYQGDAPPTVWPTAGVGGWHDDARESRPPDWAYDDGTRL